MPRCAVACAGSLTAPTSTNEAAAALQGLEDAAGMIKVFKEPKVAPDDANATIDGGACKYRHTPAAHEGCAQNTASLMLAA
jgi:hypothetical protein